MYPAALDAFQRAGATPTALLGQSRAAYALGEFDQALDCARRAIVLLSVQPDRRLEISPAAEIVLADAGLEVLHRLLANPGPASSALFDDIARALQWRIERVRTDAAAHGRLVALYLEVGKVIQAESAAQDGLNSSPGDAELTKQLARAAFSIGGPDRLLEAFEHFRKKFPLQPLGYWYPALEFFKSSVAHQTLTLFESSDKSPVNRAKQRKRAKSYFAQVRVLDPRYAASCLEYEALCVALDGWEAFDAREYEKARGAFKSMDNVLPGSVALDPASVDAQWSGQLASGASGLDKIAVLYREAKNLSASAAVYGDLADLLPNDAHWVREAAESAKLAAADSNLVISPLLNFITFIP